MARIANVEIPNKKRGEIALTYIYGIGRSAAKKILLAAKLNPDKKVNEWTEGEAYAVRKVINTDYTIEGELRREKKTHKERLYYIGCRRGIRDHIGLPVRGQNTKNNTRTRKGKKKTVANKKKATR